MRKIEIFEIFFSLIQQRDKTRRDINDDESKKKWNENFIKRVSRSNLS